MSTKKVVITGINGQLGQYMAKHLLENEPDIQVIGTIRHKSYDTQEYIFDRSRVLIELLDLSDAHSIENVIVKYKPDYFINTAANAFVGESWSVPEQHLQFNAVAVLHMLEAIRKHSPQTRFFTMGTSEEFGATEKCILNEQSKLSPKSPYGASKCASRFLVKVWRESYGLYAVQGWTFNFESKIRGEKYVTRKIAKGVARIARAIKDGKDFEPLELGNLDSYRSWQHVADVADGIWKMLNQVAYPSGKPNSVTSFEHTNTWARAAVWQPSEYVLSAPDTHSVRQFVEKSFAIANILGNWSFAGTQGNHVRPENEVYRIKDSDQILVRINPAFYRPADVTYLHGDASAIRKDLGWEPKVSFDDLVKEMVTSELRQVGL